MCAQELQLQIKDTVRAWVNNGSYLHDTVPHSVHVSPLLQTHSHVSQDDQVHFAHPIIASTAKSFYFDKWHAISTCDQETFNGSVPKPLIALIGAVVNFLPTLCKISDD